MIYLELLISNTGLFYFINNINNPFLDVIMPFISDFGNLIAWFVISALMYLFGGKKGKRVAILALFALILSSVIVGILKYSIAEPRPYVTLAHVKVLAHDTLGNYTSFPSEHASGSFAFAVVVGLKYKINFLKGLRLIYILLAIAVIVAFSRIYVGVHYPLDVLVGAIIGIICAIIVLKLENKIFNLIIEISHLFRHS